MNIEFELLKCNVWKRITAYCFLLFVIFACSERMNSEQVLDLKISDRFGLDLTNSKLTGSLDYPISSIQKSTNKFLVFNSHENRIDTIKFFSEKLSIIEGREIQYEGPKGIAPFNSFVSLGQKIVFVNGQTIFVQDSIEVMRINSNSLQKEDQSSFSNFINGPYEIITSIDVKSNRIYVFSDDFNNNQIKLLEVSLSDSQIDILRFSPLEEIKEHTIRLNQGGFQIENPYHPRILSLNNKLVISYPFTNKFQIYDLKSHDTKIMSPTSDLFKLEKDLPNHQYLDLDFIKFKEISDNWQDDVKFYPIIKLDENRYIRIVRSSIEGNRHNKYMEIFNGDFKKIQEINLSQINEDLGEIFFPLGKDLLVKAKNQPKEDSLYFYNISLK